MIADSFPCHVETCPAFEELVRHLSARRYTYLRDEYAAVLEDDPDYFVYHWMSTALRLQCQLKSHEIPTLKIGVCIDKASSSCCVVDALSEAIRRGSSGGARSLCGPE
jgi:hypothetical protein